MKVINSENISNTNINKIAKSDNGDNSGNKGYNYTKESNEIFLK